MYDVDGRDRVVVPDPDWDGTYVRLVAPTSRLSYRRRSSSVLP
jgi:hypothetical protein